MGASAARAPAFRAAPQRLESPRLSGKRNQLARRGISSFERALPRRDEKMQSPHTGPQELTLLDLTGAVIEVADSDREVVATLAHLIRSGKVRLTSR
jgi:hypothetical protein